jgi:hypothetical protein
MAEKVEIVVFDDTDEAVLSLWDCTCASAAAWVPSNTILLLSRVRFHGAQRKMLSLGNGSYVDVDPEMRDAVWLRSYAEKIGKRDHVNLPFPVEGMPG